MCLKFALTCVKNITCEKGGGSMRKHSGPLNLNQGINNIIIGLEWIELGLRKNY